VRLTFDGRVLALFPGVRVITVVARGIDNRTARPEVDAALTEAWAAAAGKVASFGNAQSHPNVSPWRVRLKGAGANPHDFPSSIEALMRRASKGGTPPRINPLVDFYNGLSLRLVVPIGGFDIAALGDGDIDVRLTRAGDTFLALDAEDPSEVPAGEVAYVHGSTVLTRHLVWRQSRPGLILPDTSDAVLLCEILGDVPRPALVDEVRSAFVEGLERWFEPASLAVGVIEDRAPSFEA
jgi:DNA/RNA-binding domain of Phe-tRNA-synthetase-like protein